MALHVDTQGEVYGFVDDPLVLPDFDDNTVQINDGVNGIQRPGLPLDDLLYNRTGDLGNQGCRYIGTLHFLEGGDDLASAHSLGVQEQDLVIH